MSKARHRSLLKSTVKNALKIHKILEDASTPDKVVDYDLGLTTHTTIEVLSAISKQPAKLQVKLCDEKALAECDKLLAQYANLLTKIHKEGKLKRFLQSTRVRKNLDILNNGVYSFIRTFRKALLEEYNGKKIKLKRNKKHLSKKWGSISLQPQAKEMNQMFKLIKDPGGRKFWKKHFPEEVPCVSFFEGIY
jgi:hypothetical protein